MIKMISIVKMKVAMMMMVTSGLPDSYILVGYFGLHTRWVLLVWGSISVPNIAWGSQQDLASLSSELRLWWVHLGSHLYLPCFLSIFKYHLYADDCQVYIFLVYTLSTEFQKYLSIRLTQSSKKSLIFHHCPYFSSQCHHLSCSLPTSLLKI